MAVDDVVARALLLRDDVAVVVGLVEVVLFDHAPLISHSPGVACESEGPKITP